MTNYASNLFQNNEIDKINKMKQLQIKIEHKTNMGLAGAFLTNGYYNKYDVIAMIANEAKYENEEGHIFYNNDTEKAVFIKNQ